MSELPLLILVTLFRFSADDKQPGKYVCTTPLSGIYSPALRYIVYAFFFIAFALRSFEWAVGPSLATAMLYSATASIHSIPIAAQRNNSGFLNPDVYPTVALTIFSLLAALPVLMWSSSFRDQAREHEPQRAETKRRHRLIVHLWVTLLFVGIISSWITSVHPVPLVDDPEACKDGIALKIHEKPLMVRLGGASDTFGTILNVCLVILVVNLVLAFLCSTSQQNPLLLTRGLNRSWTYRFCGHGVVFFIVVLLGLACIIVGLYIVACLERAMLEDNGWPCGESITNVGQWGEVVHILLALVGFAIMRVRRVDEGNQCNPHQPIDSAQVGSFGGG